MDSCATMASNAMPLSCYQKQIYPSRTLIVGSSGGLSDHPGGSMQLSLSDGPNSNQIAVLNGPYVVDIESDKRLSFARCGYELHLQAIGRVHLHDSPKISVAKTMLG
jgi:hypothetical protein